MADHSTIEWTDATWNPITGCSVLSPGCTNCYAMKLAGTRLRNHPSRAGLTTMTKAGPVWNGTVRFNEQWLTQPLGWKKAKMVFVCAHGDLFHEDVPDEWIDRVFAVMALAPQHTFQVLTKRAERMRTYMSAAHDRIVTVTAGGNENVSVRTKTAYHSTTHLGGKIQWPLPNVWLGVSTEDQRRANERIPHLLATPAAVRFVSAEPLLGPIALDEFCDGWKFMDFLRGNWWHDSDPPYIERNHPRLDWVIVGGESGPRPMHPLWARTLRDQCAAAGVPFFFKQWGTWKPTSGVDPYCHGPKRNLRQYPQSAGVAMLADGRVLLRDFSVAEHARRIREGRAHNTRAIEVDQEAIRDFNQSITDDRRASDNPLGLQWLYEAGKKAAGRLLDGIEHSAMPKANMKDERP